MKLRTIPGTENPQNDTVLRKHRNSDCCYGDVQMLGAGYLSTVATQVHQQTLWVVTKQNHTLCRHTFTVRTFLPWLYFQLWVFRKTSVLVKNWQCARSGSLILIHVSINTHLLRSDSQNCIGNLHFQKKKKKKMLIKAKRELWCWVPKASSFFFLCPFKFVKKSPTGNM